MNNLLSPLNAAKTRMDGSMGLLVMPLLCLCAAFVGFSLPVSWQIWISSHIAWPLGLLILLALLFTLLRKESLPPLSRLKNHARVFICAALLCAVLINHDRITEKVLHDELILQGSAMQLLYNNQYRVPVYAHNLHWHFEIFSNLPDKRPPLFPVLLSLLHRIIGYAAYNGFILNAILAVVLLFFVHKGAAIIGSAHSGYAAMLLLATLPLLSQNITSQHFEVLYLTLIAWLVWQCLRCLSEDRPDGLPIAYLLAIMISLTRYEGLLFMFVPFATHALLVWRGGKVTLPPHLFPIAAIAIFYLFAHIAYVLAHPHFWQLSDRASDAAFGIAYWEQNIPALFEFLMRADRSHPNSLLLSILGFAALPVAIAHALNATLSHVRTPRQIPVVSFMLLVIATVVAGILLLTLSYHWGQVNTPVTARFMLFPCLFFVFCFVYALTHRPKMLSFIALAITVILTLQIVLREGATIPLTVFLMICVIAALPLVPAARNHLRWSLPLLLLSYLAIETLPAIHQGRYERDAGPMKSNVIFRNWIQQHANQNAVFIPDSALYAIVQKESASSIARLNSNPATMMDHLQSNRFSNAFVFQNLRVYPDGSRVVMSDWQLAEGIFYEEVLWQQIDDRYAARMIRLTGYQAPDAVPASKEIPSQ